MFGLSHRLLVIDATHKSFDIEQISDGVLGRTLGGKGLATHLLLQHNPPKVDPLSPENHLIFAIGPVTGTAIWGSCRHGVYTKSPQTGYYSESYSGGKAAEYLAAAGFDAVMIYGASAEPVWVEISEEAVHFHSATGLWGRQTYETEDHVKAWVKTNRPDARNCAALVIGPGAENGVTFSVIENDYWRSAGRTGVGTVMGSKMIKAVAFWGRRKKEIADPDLLKRFSQGTAQGAKENAGVKAYKSLGTPMMVDIMSNVGSFPTRYWSKGTAEHREQINATALHKRCDVQPRACSRCFIACGRLATVKGGRHKGLRIEGPEYETIYAFGGLCEVNSIEEIAYLNDVCDRLGIDTISAGNLVALTMEASRQGKIDYDIAYGDVDRISELLHDIAYRRGIGDTLARGIKVAAETVNMSDQAIHVKGLEPAGYDPRVLKGMGLAYGTSDRGACHLRTTFYKPELAKMIDPEQITGKGEMLAEWEDRLAIFDSLVLCRFYRDLYQWEQLSTIIKAVTGLTLDKDAMRRIARTIADGTRRFNIREGLTSQEDKLPKRFYTEALPETSKVITEAQMNQLLLDYYRARGWDDEGVPPSQPNS
jgi:aldehyde:ferredoxin oxidoreductase